MSSLDIPSLIPLPESSTATPQTPSPNASNDHLASLLTHAASNSIFAPESSMAKAPITPTRPIPIPGLRTPQSPEFGSFVASAHYEPLGVHELLSFEPPQLDVDPIKEDFFDRAHERVKDRKERVVRELIEHEDEPMYWHPRQVVTTPEGVEAEPSLETSPTAVSPPLSDLSMSPSSEASHPRLSREERATDPGPSTATTTAAERHVARSRSRDSSPSTSPSRYDSLRRTFSRGVASLFSHAAASPPLASSVPKNPQMSTSPKPYAPSIASSLSSTWAHSSPFAAHHHPTAPPTGAPGFWEPEFDWDKGDWRSDPSITDSKRRLLTEKVDLRGRGLQTSPVLLAEVAALIRPWLPPLARLPKSWTLLYSLDQHGISIHTFYREIAKSFEPPNPSIGGCVLAVRDERGGVFGVWIGEKIRMGGGSYYGSGESFLWKLVVLPKGEEAGSIKVFKWSGKNDYVALCEDDYISFGGGDGRTGLYLDSAFDRGYSERCPCFENEPLCYTTDGVKGRFSCVGLEVWRVGL